MGELGGLRAVSGESSDDLSHVDVGNSGVLGNGTSGEAGNGDSGSETHFDGIKVVVLLVDVLVLKVCSWYVVRRLDSEWNRCIDRC